MLEYFFATSESIFELISKIYLKTQAEGKHSILMSLNFPSKKNAPFQGKFQGYLIMREIGSVADDLDVGAVAEGVFIHIAVTDEATIDNLIISVQLLIPHCFGHDISYTCVLGSTMLTRM